MTWSCQRLLRWRRRHGMLQEYDQETKDYEVERHSVFWSDEGCKSLYKNHLKCAPCRSSPACTTGSRLIPALYEKAPGCPSTWMPKHLNRNNSTTGSFWSHITCMLPFTCLR